MTSAMDGKQGTENVRTNEDGNEENLDVSNGRVFN